MNAVAAIVRVLLIGLACGAALGLVALAAYVVTVCRRHHAAWHQSAPSWRPTGSEEVELPGDREVVSLRQAIIELRAQLTDAHAALDAADRPGEHQHLHFHGLDPGQVAAILAAHRKQGGDDR
jgi:hypothetical protein